MKTKPSKKTPSKSAKSAARAKPPAAEHVHDENCGHDHGHEHDGCCDHDHGVGGLEIGIRLYKPDDYKELKAVWKLGEIVVDDTDSAKMLKENSEKRKNSYRIFIAEAHQLDAKTGKPFGKSRVAAGVICTFDGVRVYLYHFAVHPDFRGLGLGSALLETCEHQAELWGAKHLRLMSRVDAGRDSARSLYEKHGWVSQKNLCQYSRDID